MQKSFRAKTQSRKGNQVLFLILLKIPTLLTFFARFAALREMPLF
jgi:hypothetical protein